MLIHALQENLAQASNEVTKLQIQAQQEKQKGEKTDVIDTEANQEEGNSPSEKADTKQMQNIRKKVSFSLEATKMLKRDIAQSQVSSTRLAN